MSKELRARFEALRAEDLLVPPGPIEAQVERELGIDLYCVHDEEAALELGRWLAVLQRELGGEGVSEVEEVFLVPQSAGLSLGEPNPLEAGFHVGSLIALHDRPVGRKLFTLAHEVGHNLIRSGSRPSVLDFVELGDPPLDGAGAYTAGGVYWTPYSCASPEEWACESYGAFLEACYELGGPLLRVPRSDMDLAGVREVLRAYRDAGWLRAESAEFLERIMADAQFAEMARRLGVILGHRQSPNRWSWSSIRSLGAASAALPEYPWSKVQPEGDPRPIEFGLLSVEGVEALGAMEGGMMLNFDRRECARIALCELLEMGGVPAAPLLNKAAVAWKAGDEAEARSILSAGVERAVAAILAFEAAVEAGDLIPVVDSIHFDPGARDLWWTWTNDVVGMFAGLGPSLERLPEELLQTSAAARTQWIIDQLGLIGVARNALALLAPLP